MSESSDRYAGLTFPFGLSRGVGEADGKAVKVAESIMGVRHSLPFALDHVNCWVLGEPGNQVLIDTGADTPNTRKLWQDNLPHSCSGSGAPRPAALLVTHFHPDHMGLAGWFAEQGVTLLGSAIETDFSRLLWNIEDQTYADFYAQWYASNGLPEATISAVRQNANTYKKLVHQPPEASSWSHLKEGETVNLGGHDYQVLVGRGHAPDMLMLYRESDHVLIAADQVLPSITPNVSVMPRIQDANPLLSFLDSLAKLRQLPEDTLVLPSHGAPFTGLWARLDALNHHHEQRLAEVLDACNEPRSAYELFGVLFRRELDAQQTSFALGESLAHLHYLEANGDLSRIERNGVASFVRA